MNKYAYYLLYFFQNNFLLLLNLYFFTYLTSFAFQIGEYFKQNKSLEIKNYGSMKEVVFCLVLKCKCNTYSSMRYDCPEGSKFSGEIIRYQRCGRAMSEERTYKDIVCTSYNLILEGFPVFVVAGESPGHTPYPRIQYMNESRCIFYRSIELIIYKLCIRYASPSKVMTSSIAVDLSD